MSTTILIRPLTGTFAEDKDVARDIRLTKIEPALGKRGTVVLDFKGVSLTTQSFVHAMLSATIRSEGAGVLDRIEFKSCAPAVKTLIKLVCEYSQETDLERLGELGRRSSVPGPGRVRRKKK